MGPLTVLNPFLLFGALAALIPLIIHLIQRRRVQRVIFGSVWFLRNVARRIARRRRASEMILLILRMLILALLAVAFARPFLLPRGDGSDKNVARGLKALAILIDRSASMSVGDRMEKAKKQALVAIDSLRLGDAVAVYTFGNHMEPLVDWSVDPAPARRAIEDLKPSDEGTRLADALKTVHNALLDRREPDKRVLLVYDGQANAWSDYLEDWSFSGKVGLIPPGPIGDGPTPPNVGFVQLGVPQKAVVGSGAEVLTARIKNYSEKEQRVEVALVVDGQPMKETRRLALPPKTAQPVSWRYEFKRAGDVPGRFEFKLDDALARDNQGHFVVEVSPKVKVVLVNGSPSTNPREDDAYYLARALAPGEESIFQVQEVTPAAWKGERLDGVGAVVLADVNELSEQAARNLKVYLHAGGGVLFFAGTKTVPETFNRVFKDIAPCRLDRRVDAFKEHQAMNGLMLNIERKEEHPIFQPFSQPHYGDFGTIRFREYFQVSDSQAAKVLARYETGKSDRPAILIKDMGKGHSMLVTSSADLEMNDFCLRGVFVPFLHETAKYLAASGLARNPNVWAGADVSAELPPGEDSATLVAPSGAEEKLEPLTVSEKKDAAAAGPERQFVQFTPADQGIYRLTAGKLEHLYAVNLDPREGDLDRRPFDEIAQAMKGTRGVTEDGGKTAQIQPEQSELKEMEKAQRLGWLILVLAAVLLTAEMILADRITIRD